jgi:LuxR family maltose regulon positive regulatory protein
VSTNTVPPATSNLPVLPLLATKLACPPPSPTLVPRSRLTARLRDAAGRLVLVVAPAGSGKSSLVAEWCRERAPRRVAWLSLDAGDNDPARFLRYVCAALEQVSPEAAGPVSQLLRAPGAPAPEHALFLLLNAVAASAEPAALVLDDYHEIEAPAVHRLLTLVVEHWPPNMCLILVTRREPPLPLARLRANGQMLEVRGADHCFTTEEASCLLNDRMGLALTPEAVGRLTGRTEGWALGLQLAALSLQGHPAPEDLIDSFTGSHRYVVDYLVEEVLSRQSDGVNAFLRQTAVLERLCGPLCDAVTGTPSGHGQAMLEQLEASGLFLIPLDAERRWYRYHPLFTEAVRARTASLGAGSQPVPPTELHERAASWFEAEGLTGEAMEHALAGGHWERAARLIERSWEPMFRHDEMRTLERWLRAMPPEVPRERPLLALAAASVGVYYLRASEAEEALVSLRIDPHEENPPHRDFLGKLESLRGFIARLRSDDDGALRHWQRSLQLLDAADLFWRGPALHELGALHLNRGEPDRAAVVLAEAMAAARQDENPAVLLRTAYTNGRLREGEGALSEAAGIYQDALRYARERAGGPMPAAALLLVGLGRIERQRNDLTGALAHLEEAAALAGRPPGAAWAGGDHAGSWICAFELLLLRAALGDAAGADALFDLLAGRQRTAASPLLARLLTVLRVQRRQAPAAEVAGWLESFERRLDGAEPGRPGAALPPPTSAWCASDSGAPEGSELELLTWARLRLAQGQSILVRSRLERLLEGLLRRGQEGAALVARASLAVVYWQERRRDRAVAVLEPALALAAREGQVRDFLETGIGLVPVLRYCAAQGVYPACCEALLAALADRRVPAKRSLPAGVPPGTPAGALLEPLSPRELEVLRLLAEGHSNEQLAAQLFLTVGTVKRHLHQIYGKLQATSRTSAVARARDLALL